MHDLPHHDLHGDSLRLPLTLLPVLTILVSSGCTDSSPVFSKPGALFVAGEKAPPSKALVYLYWPREEQGRREHISVSSCAGHFEEVLPGGFARFPVDPGQRCFEASWVCNLDSISASVGTEPTRLDLNVEPGQTLFVRVEKGDGLFSDIALRLVEPAKAEPEIGRCRQTVPMTLEEMSKALSERG